jgi:hypothetical protein
MDGMGPQVCLWATESFGLGNFGSPMLLAESKHFFQLWPKRPKRPNGCCVWPNGTRTAQMKCPLGFFHLIISGNGPNPDIL